MPKAADDPARKKRYQQKHLAGGLCTKCPNKVVKWGLCRKHLNKQYSWYEERRIKLGMKVRYKKRRFGKLKPVTT